MEKEKRAYVIKEGRKPGRRPGVRPDLWVSGPDPIMHKYFRLFVQHRNQAFFRNEGYELLFEQWLELWGDKIEERGRKTGQYQMRRINSEKSWKLDNIYIKLVDKN